MKDLIKAPDILPNNMRQIRVMRGISIEELSSALSLNHSYISILETFKANMSGLTALNIMKYLGANFTQFFDVKEKLKLPYTIDTYEDIEVKTNICAKHIDITNTRNIIHIEEHLEKYLKNNNIDGKIVFFDIIEKDDNQNQDIINATLNVTLLKQTQVEEEFNINFFEETDNVLFEKLYYKGFTEEKEVTLQADDLTIKDGKIYVLNTKKLQMHGRPYNTEYPVISKDEVKFNNDKNGNLKSIQFSLLFDNANNIKYIQDYLNLTDKDVQTALGIGENTYKNLLKGEQKLSTKLMWRLCMLFRVPLELIINIPLYMEKHG